MIKVRKEDFGYIICRPFKDIKIYSHDIEPFLKEPLDDQKLFSRHELTSFMIPAEQFHLRSPLYVYIEVTQRCNLKCKHCYNVSGLPRDRELTTSDFVRLLDELARINVFSVLFTGGEPFLRSDITYLLSYAYSKGFDVAVLTNGTLLTQYVLEKIPKGVVLGISLDGVGAHKKMRGSVCFEDMIPKFNLVKDAGIFFTVLTTMNKDNIDELGNMYKWCVDNDIVFVMLECLPVGRARNHMELILDESDIVKGARLFVLESMSDYVLEKAYKNKTFAGSSIDILLDFVTWLEVGTRMCKGARAIAYISSDGNVYPCSNCSATGLFRAGNISKNSVEEIWNTSFRDIRNIKWKDFRKCKKCEVQRTDCVCQFRCPALSMALHGDQFVCGATPYIEKNLLLKTIIRKLIDSGVEREDILECFENATYESLPGRFMRFRAP